MNQALGDKLRAAREAKGQTIEQLSSITKLNQEFIVALESGRWDLLPGHIYLKPFTKTCAEALDLDFKELYKIIDGDIASMEQTQILPTPVIDQKKKFDYRFPVIAVGVLAVVAVIILIVNSKQSNKPGVDQAKVVPAKGYTIKKEIKWQRPWEEPPADLVSFNRNRLRLEISDVVRVRVIAGKDTLCNEYLQAGTTKTFTSLNQFVVTLGRNDCVIGYFDGIKIPGIGVSSQSLYNFKVGTII